MAITVKNNTAAGTALKDLNRTSRALSRSFERISSGLRISRAAEAACGAKMAELEAVFCAPAPGVVPPNPALRAAYDALEAQLARALA